MGALLAPTDSHLGGATSAAGLGALPLDAILCGDAIETLRGFPSGSVDMILTDPPYHRVKSRSVADWDNQWETAATYLAWLGACADEWARLLKPNGSLYCFASPQMAARVEVLLGERFNVLNHIVWRKSSDGANAGQHARAHKEGLRAYFPTTERILFAEHHGADSMALGESGYAAQCERLRGFVFESIRAYLDGERRRAGITNKQVKEATGTQMQGHWFTRIQWCLPTAAHYATLRRLFNERGRRPAPPFGEYHPEGSPWRRFHLPRLVGVAGFEGEAPAAEYLRADYEYLRRPFSVTRDVPYTDVWDFATVPGRPGKHPCEKPQALLRHAILASSRPGDVILDCFCGSGSTCEAALRAGRRFVAVERDPLWAERARRRVDSVRRELAATPRAVPAPPAPVVTPPKRTQAAQARPRKRKAKPPAAPTAAPRAQLTLLA